MFAYSNPLSSLLLFADDIYAHRPFLHSGMCTSALTFSLAQAHNLTVNEDRSVPIGTVTPLIVIYATGSEAGTHLEDIGLFLSLFPALACTSQNLARTIHSEPRVIQKIIMRHLTSARTFSLYPFECNLYTTI